MYNNNLVVIARIIPEAIAKSSENFTLALADHKRLATTISGLKSDGGLYLFYTHAYYHPGIGAR